MNKSHNAGAKQDIICMINQKESSFRRLIIPLAISFSVTSAVFLVWSVVPEEQTPARSELRDGTVSFVLQSQREATAWVAGASAILIQVIMFKWLQSRRIQDTANDSCRRPWRRAFAGLLVCLLILLFLKMMLYDPFFKYRAVRLTSHDVILSSLYWTWTIQLSEIGEGKLVVKDVSRGGHDWTDIYYLFRDIHGNAHASVLLTNPSKSAELQRYRVLLNSMDKEWRELKSKSK